MNVTFSLPEDIARELQERWGDLSRRALEFLVAQAYREELLTLGEVRRVLGHETRMETEGFPNSARFANSIPPFLKQRGVNYRERLRP